MPPIQTAEQWWINYTEQGHAFPPGVIGIGKFYVENVKNLYSCTIFLVYISQLSSILCTMRCVQTSFYFTILSHLRSPLVFRFPINNLVQGFNFSSSLCTQTSKGKTHCLRVFASDIIPTFTDLKWKTSLSCIFVLLGHNFFHVSRRNGRR